VNRTKSVAVVILAGALVAASCSGDDDEAGSNTSVSSETTTANTEQASSTTLADATATTVRATTTTTTIPDVPRMPLTGEPIADESEVPDRPALVVKISNAPASVVPQAGLNQADIVFEEVINDGATRLAAVFHSEESEIVGPVRSGRAQDVNLLLSLQRPLFAWSGGNPAVTRAIEESDLIDLSALKSSGYYRRTGRRDPNNLYSSTEALWAQTTDEAGRPMSVFPYARLGETTEGRSAAAIEVSLDDVTAVWEYDTATDGYYRRQNGDEHTTETPDGVEQVWTRNVVVVLADYGVNTFDGNPDAQVLGSNPVYVFTSGTVQRGEWLRFEPEDPFEFYDNFDDLNRLVMQPGPTWVEIPRNGDDVDDVLIWEP